VTAVPDIQILLPKHKVLWLLKAAYGNILVPTSVIQEVQSNTMDQAISEGWLELLDPDTDYVMRVDEIESRSGIGLSTGEEDCIALALQHEAHPIVTNDREVGAVAKLLGIRTEGIPSVILRASNSGAISKEDGLRLFHEVYRSICPSLGEFMCLYELFTGKMMNVSTQGHSGLSQENSLSG